MRNLTAAILAWLMPPRGKRRATAPMPAQTSAMRTPLPPLDTYIVDDLPLVRPYVTLLERAEVTA